MPNLVFKDFLSIRSHKTWAFLEIYVGLFFTAMIKKKTTSRNYLSTLKLMSPPPFFIDTPNYKKIIIFFYISHSNKKSMSKVIKLESNTLT